MEDCYFVNPNYNYSAVNMAPPSSSDFVLSDYLMLDDHHESWSHSTETESAEKAASSDATHHGLIGDAAITSSNNNNIKCKSSGTKRNNGEIMSGRITFRTRSQLEIMDDGYKWRKYGKKSVKNSPNPRNYYKCSSEGCGVKKRVERDREEWKLRVNEL